METNDVTRATAQAMPEINRRRMLMGLAASTTTAAVIVAETAGAASMADNKIAENPALVSAWKEYRSAETECLSAKEALEWLADEWKHLWPLAPEEILGSANAQDWGAGDDERRSKVERDIIGRPMMRDTSALTKRNIPKGFREKYGKATAFFIDQPDRLADDLADLRDHKPSGRTAKSFARNRKRREDHIANLETRLRLATEYHAETQRIRSMAGVAAVKERIKIANKNVDAAAVALSRVSPLTLVGLRLKADALLSCLERWGIPRNDSFIFAAVWRLAEDTLEATQDLDGKGSATPLPTLKGGAA